MKLILGGKAPAFSLPDQDGVMRSLSDYKGQYVLMYFYPKDDTPGCTKEACSIRDSFPFFESLDAKVLGISIDSVKSHKKFVDKYSLPFTILSDQEKKVVNLYGVWTLKKMMGREYKGTLRTSFLIDPKGIIKKIYTTVKPELHAQEVIDDLKSMKK